MKQLMVKMARCVLPCACLWACAAGGFTVDGDLPAGNVIVEGIKGDVVKQRQDLRDSNMWFYWAFRVRGAAGF